MWKRRLKIYEGVGIPEEGATSKHAIQSAVSALRRGNSFRASDLPLQQRRGRDARYLRQMRCLEDTGVRRGRGRQTIFRRVVVPRIDGSRVCEECDAIKSGTSGCVIFDNVERR